MENIFKCKVDFTQKNNYFDVTIHNNVYDVIELDDATVKYSLNVIRTELDAINVEFYSLDSIVLTYTADDNNITEILDDVKLKEYSINIDVNKTQFTGLLLTGFEIDVIKKTINLIFN